MFYHIVFTPVTFFCRELEESIKTHTDEFEKLSTEKQSKQEDYVNQRRQLKDQMCKIGRHKEEKNKLREEEKLLNKKLSKDHDA